MSEMYEGVVFHAVERAAHRIFDSLSTPLRLRLVRLSRGLFGVYRVAGRADAIDQPGLEQVAQRVSVEVGNAVALLYDNSCGFRAGVLFSGGQRGREFGDGDAWWVPYGEDGELILDGPRLRVTELRRGEEYDCIYTAIDAALEAVAAGTQVSADLVKQAFCYEEAMVLAESTGRTNHSTRLGKDGSAPMSTASRPRR